MRVFEFEPREEDLKGPYHPKPQLAVLERNHTHYRLACTKQLYLFFNFSNNKVVPCLQREFCFSPEHCFIMMHPKFAHNMFAVNSQSLVHN